MGMRYEAEVCTNEINMNGTLLTADVFRATLAGSVMAVMQANFTDCVAKSAQLSNYFHCITESRSPCKNGHTLYTIHPRGETVPNWCNALRYSFVQCYYCC